MKIDTSILRNELMKPIEVGDTTDEYNKGWHECTVAVEEAIRRAEQRTIQTEENPQEVSIIGEPVEQGLLRDVIYNAMAEGRTVQIRTEGKEIEIKIFTLDWE